MSSIPSPGILATIAAVFRQNRVPCLVLNLFAVALVASYYQVPSLAGFWELVGDFKTRWSFVFSCVSTMFAAAVMPFFILMAMGTLPSEGRWQRLALLMLFWGYRGMEIDLFYRFQGWLFGQGNDARTLLIKVVVDQFVLSPLWFVPTYVIALRWVDLGGSWSHLRASLDREFWTRTCPMVLITNWIIWIPALACVYSLPAALQFPLFTIVMCFFILVVTVMTRRKNEADKPAKM
ncbi:hypothetical protein [Prosthecobacter sp.]|uniref:hypothetical protein n=1 Tax=Prosthecobacter sp. TaxID=1965333 RepID=UPI002AB81855|nr:hypothetical protein [Prosthecobacter sp.]MDZ4403901.1 hypothetical protein [Prosthecobacter sp.]